VNDWGDVAFKIGDILLPTQFTEPLKSSQNNAQNNGPANPI
jgi:hypothetical protein